MFQHHIQKTIGIELPCVPVGDILRVIAAEHIDSPVEELQQTLVADFHTDEHADNLSNNSARAKEWREEWERTDKRQDNQAYWRTGQGGQKIGNHIADARGQDNTDQHGYKSHERQNGLNHRVDGITAGLIEYGYDTAHELTDFGHQAAFSLLLGNLFARVILGFLHRFCTRCRSSRAIAESDIVHLDCRYVDISLDMLCQGAGRAGRIQIDGEDTFLRIDTAAQRTATVDNYSQRFLIRYAGFEAVHDLAARHFA